ncbi:PRC-barrel domain-containing protein [Methylobacterium durans]|uniref:Photosystem reaction center subunit H n=1 Tax=Methylobacterium durans TaxID=2202825 RepID=A0A2U8WB65_9HYPH|nr:PRC-barrel domain-containing protein [Methylobacterium durans]AWN43394.1 photosystem reaction center subunit H [Methylobacterium durans]
MTIRTLLAAALVAGLPSLALAQETAKPDAGKPGAAPSATASPTPNSSSAAAVADGGMKMADSATAKVQFITTQPADTLTSKLVGLSVYNNSNETVGEIEDFVILDGKTIHAVIIGVGGFLGIGERYVAVSPASVTLSKKDDRLRALVNTSKDELKNAPAFEYRKKS